MLLPTTYSLLEEGVGEESKTGSLMVALFDSPRPYVIFNMRALHVFQLIVWRRQLGAPLILSRWLQCHATCVSFHRPAPIPLYALMMDEGCSDDGRRLL